MVSPDHKVFVALQPAARAGRGRHLHHAVRPVRRWRCGRSCRRHARKTIRERKIKFFVIDGFAVAKPHAPTPELETRMMGIAFIGAVCGHVDRVVSGASQEVMLEKIRNDLAKKFGAKGGAVVEGNMTVIRDGVRGDHEGRLHRSPNSPGVDARRRSRRRRAAPRSRRRCADPARRRASQPLRPRILRRHWSPRPSARAPSARRRCCPAPACSCLAAARPARTRACSAATCRSSTRTSAPAAWNARWSARTPPSPTPCTTSTTCSTRRSPSSISPSRSARRCAARSTPLGEAVREIYRQSKERQSLPRRGRRGGGRRSTSTSPTLRRNLASMAEAVARLPGGPDAALLRRHGEGRARFGRPLFRRHRPVEVLGLPGVHRRLRPGALTERQQDEPLLEPCRTRFEFLSHLPNTPSRFVEGATEPDGDTKRLMLDRNNYYATTGGHGACRGCGEVTAIRLVTSANHAIHERRRKEHIRELEDLIGKLNAKQATVDDAERRERIGQTRQDAREAAVHTTRPAPPATARPRRWSPTPPAARASTPRPSPSTPTTIPG